MPFVSPKWKYSSFGWIILIWIACSNSSRVLEANHRHHLESVSYARRASLAAATLQSWYNADAGLYRTTGWWNSANAITALADYSRVSGSKKYWPVFLSTLSAAQKTFPGFINKFYDDEGWWALAWIDVYELTHDLRYLSMADQIFADMTGGWDNTCAGGIWWSKDRKYKNAIANELFLDVAASLASISALAQRRSAYRDWAEKEWGWFAHSDMINGDHLVNDGLNSSCANNLGTVWTYNQGVIAGGLIELYMSDGDDAHLMEAQQISDASISTLTDGKGILHDSCEPRCGADGTQFKGIFVRNLRLLDATRRRPIYEQFILRNADSVWAQVRVTDYHLGAGWAEPYGPSDASSQSSALDLILAAAGVSKLIAQDH